MHRWLLLNDGGSGWPMLIHSSNISTVEMEVDTDGFLSTVVKTFPEKGEYGIYYVMQTVGQIADVLDAANLRAEDD